MLMGIHVPDGNYAAANAAFGGHLKLARVFPSGMPVDVTATTPAQMVNAIDAVCAPVIAAGMIPYFSYKFAGEPSVVTGGQADAHLAAIKAYVLAHPSNTYYSSWHHEDEQTSITDSQFVSAFSYAYSRTATINNLVGPIYQGYPYETVAFRAARIPTLYDYLAMDVYSQDFMGKKYSLDKMAEMITFINVIPHTAPIFLTERGITNGSGSTPPWDPALQAETLQADFDYLDALPNPVVGYTYWNQHADPGKLADYTLNSAAAALYSARATTEAGPPPPPPPAPPVPVEIDPTVTVSDDPVNISVQPVLHIDPVTVTVQPTGSGTLGLNLPVQVALDSLEVTFTPEITVDELEITVQPTVGVVVELDLIKCGVCAALLRTGDDVQHYAALHPSS